MPPICSVASAEGFFKCGLSQARGAVDNERGDHGTDQLVTGILRSLGV